MGGFDNLTQFLQKYEKFILTAHETPDGDAIGSECAMYFALKQMGKQVLLYNSDPAAQKYSYLQCAPFITHLKEKSQLPQDINEYVLLILDTNDIHNIGVVSELILPQVKDYFIVDHHESDDNVIEVNHIEESASSTCEILFELFDSLGLEFTLPMAEAIFTGIVYDTGSFIYPKTSPRTFMIAHILTKIGVNPNHIYQCIYESNSVSALRLQSKVLSTLELFYEQHVAAQTMTKEMIAECGAMYEEADTLINIPLKSESIRVSLFFKENEAGILRCSLRSKGNINVAEIAQSYGGGGHKTAAGFKSIWPLETIKQKVLDKLSSYFPEAQ